MQYEAHKNKEGDVSSCALVVYRPGPRCKLEDEFETTLRLLREYGYMRVSLTHVAKRLGVGRVTLWRFMSKFPEAEEAFELGRSELEVDISRSLISNALSGNVTAQIWLSKQYLGHRDRQEPATAVGPSHEEMLDQLA